MDIYAFAAQKGGVGKTTLAGHLAVEAAQAGSVVLVDTDPQGSLGHWWEARAGDQLHFADAQPRQLPVLLKQWQESGVKAVFLDTPPAISETIREVVQLSDLVVVPTKPRPTRSTSGSGNRGACSAIRQAGGVRDQCGSDEGTANWPGGRRPQPIRPGGTGDGASPRRFCSRND